MKFMIRVFFCLGLLFPCSSFADDLLRGIAVDAPSMPTSLDDSYGKAYWDELANTGTNFLRLQYSNSSVLLDESAYREWMAEVLEHLDLILPIAAQYNMKVMFSLHSPPGGRDESGKRPIDRLFLPEYAWAKQVLLDFWDAAAKKYNNDPTVAAYLVMGEPAPVERSQWKEFSSQLANAVRSADTTPIASQPAIVLMAIYGNPANASSIQIPNDGGVYVAGFNMYFPWKYTHQGLFDDNVLTYPHGSTDADSFRARDCSLLPTKKKRRKCRKRQKNKNKNKNKNGSKAGKKKNKPNPLTKAGLALAMKKFLRFANKNGVKAAVGEYSVVANAPGAAEYLTDLTDLFNQNGIMSAYHIWDEAPIWSLKHNCTDKNNCTLADTPTDRMLAIQSFFSNNAADQ